MCEYDFAAALLDWYDDNARKLPWRISPQQIAHGKKPDPYLIWLSEIMLQQTTVVTVKDYFDRFIKRWPTVLHLAAAQDAEVMAEWAGLGYYARARNLLKCARFISDHLGGRFPDDPVALLLLPGVGSYTAAALSAIAFDLPEVVIDGNVKRVIARLFAIKDPLDKAMPTIQANAKRLTPKHRPGDYAQAIMDLGATICTPKSPKCSDCPWDKKCKAHDLGVATQLPLKVQKPPKPTRNGLIYIACRTDGAWLLERRPEKGLLGGMLGWPGSEWGADPQPKPPFAGHWQASNAEIRHTFTHFHLRLSLLTLNAPIDAVANVGSFIPSVDFERSDLPTLMRKVYDAAQPAFHSGQSTGIK